MAFFVVMVSAPQYIQPLWDAAFALCGFFGIGPHAVGEGYNQFRFWQPAL